MKLTSRIQKTSKSVNSNKSPIGPDCISIKPPSYGIDVVDNGIVQGKFIQHNETPQQANTDINPPPQVAQRLVGPETQGPFQDPFDVGESQEPEQEGFIEHRITGSKPPIQRQSADDPPVNRTGMPNPLKAGLEELSGTDLSGVRVHYNSAKPAKINALAYTQGQNIHVGPGQERHLPHEGWHAVQQMQGRVKPTMQAKGMSINDDAALEREADIMGARAIQRYPTKKNFFVDPIHLPNNRQLKHFQSSFHNSFPGSPSIQRVQINGREVSREELEEYDDGEYDVFFDEMGSLEVNLQHFFAAIDSNIITKLEGDNPKAWAESAQNQLAGKEKELEALHQEAELKAREEIQKARELRIVPEHI